jgi:hypothetical protein
MNSYDGLEELWPVQYVPPPCLKLEADSLVWILIIFVFTVCHLQERYQN